MSDQQAPAYFSRRARQEQIAAETATDERAARPHRELAREYRKRASGKEAPDGEEPETVGSGILSSDFHILP
jgi:hypothetical protein